MSVPLNAASRASGASPRSMALISTPRSLSLVTSDFESEVGRTPTIMFYWTKSHSDDNFKRCVNELHTYFPDSKSPSTIEDPVVPVPPRTNTVGFEERSLIAADCGDGRSVPWHSVIWANSQT